jgi:BirA family biotin operon repressor/biotin-[acetyl-CoA-carboxylase] ligase
MTDNKHTNYLSSSLIREHLDIEPIQIITYRTTGSTNDEARRLLKEGAKGTILIAADEQTAGRGRKGHSFFSPSSGLYYTLVLHPQDEQSAIARMTIAAAVSLYEAVRSCTGISCDIKWVNDLYLNGKKTAGILCEAPRDSKGRLLGIITGIGINIYTESFPDDIKQTAGSLNCPDLDKNLLAARLTERLISWADRLHDPALIAAYKEHSFLLGREVSFEQNGQFITGTAADINDEGNLIVEADRTYVLSSGEVSLRSWESPDE